ncbi:MAG TPA: flavin reductase family protein [Candidatus Marinimicrobia bacterium]|mgnify:CR=1 FL=1|nr:flavin reductase family protein [Candidatus Neomarinimicrobiota bacterium]
MIITKIEGYYQYYPVVAAVIGVEADGKKNFMTAAWHSPVSFDPPMYGVSIAPQRYTHNMIQKAGDFTVNFLPYSELEKIHGCGRLSGADTDKIAYFGLHPVSGHIINSPYLEEAYAAFECAVYSATPGGDHTWFMGEIKAIHGNDDAFVNKILNLEKCQPALYAGDSHYTTADSKIISRLQPK